ncbi:hypothetical protein ONA91_28980 [Micromonospora sp. DR5-3]|uniref:hypothetical protein n=1 Tax=unclassified Micromonospora TaxID=2617518 RepID=UPI001CA34C23|nr:MULTISPECIES: hypothetical protein [unclassified Micromonospora]MCW3818483.1 hypothetical protein [Micromonospora sp. DR5-3]
MRGFGPTRFRDDTTMRSGQQAALAQDLLDFMNALGMTSLVQVSGSHAKSLRPARTS